ncbi:MAG: hypothetical protein IK104_04780 [Clostridia bacterium]|nr:hypothetical protein [Clostridia bacterium]
MNDPIFSALRRKEPEAQKRTGAGKRVGAEEVRAARAVLDKYAAAKANLERRVTENERWFRLRHWEQLRAENGRENRPSAWLFHSIVNKHADFMDALPRCTVLPREKSDAPAAEALSSVIPAVLERCDWPGVYSDAAWSKLKTGTAVYAVQWDPAAAGGIGDVSVRSVDLHAIFWEPGVREIQKSRNLFVVENVDNDVLTEQYPFLEGKLSGGGLSYVFDEQVDTAGKSAVIDWYYKKRGKFGETLHYCKFVGDEVLYASENDDELCERGWYDHGQYPFVFDPLFKESGTPVGFGFIDVMKGAQEEIDILDNEIVRSARLGARRRYFTRNEGAINEEEFADFSRDFVHVSGSSLGEDSIREISSAPLSPVYLTVLNNKISELKETSGNRDFQAGSVAGGVTSGVAITALQEAGSKLSRDMIGASYRAFSAVCALVLELIRQFYSASRAMRVLGEDGSWRFLSYDNSALQGKPPAEDFGLDFAPRVPVFDLTVRAEKQPAYSRAGQNADAISFYNMGFFDPARAVESLACLEILDVDDKEKLRHLIEENGRRHGTLGQTPGAGIAP